MLAAQDGDWGFFGQCGADGVGAALVFVPRGAGRQGNTVGPVNEVGIADGFKEQAVGVGQDHHAARFADLLVDMLHDRPPLSEQEAVAILFSLERHAIHGFDSRDGMAFAQSEAPATFPRTENHRIDQAIEQRAHDQKTVVAPVPDAGREFRPIVEFVPSLLRRLLYLYL